MNIIQSKYIEFMAKKKKGAEGGFGSSGNPFMEALDEMQSGLSEEQQMQLMKGTGACPPDDCGGVGGCRYLLNVLKNPQSDEYEEMAEWVGSDFDPKKLDIAQARKLGLMW